MKNRFLKFSAVAAASASILLSGCAQKLWFGQNAQRDLYECQAEASKNYSPALYNSTVGTGYRTPSYTTCNSYGNYANCTTTGGNYVPPTQITLDANQRNRETHFAYCMLSRGNQLMTQDEYNSQRSAISYEKPPSQQQQMDQKQRQRQRNPEMCKDKYSLSYDPGICSQ